MYMFVYFLQLVDIVPWKGKGKIVPEGNPLPVSKRQAGFHVPDLHLLSKKSVTSSVADVTKSSKDNITTINITHSRPVMKH